MISVSSRPSPRIALLGCGAVGRAVAHALLERERAGHVKWTRVLVRDVDRDRGLPRERFTDSFEAILADEPDIIIEVLGGLDPAHEYVQAALSRGISVVSANKTLIAHHGRALAAVAEESGAALAFEAAVCAGVPVIAACGQLATDRISSLRGVLSGSCNFILTRMEKTGCELSEALRDAERLGLVEPDPEADISGRDAAEKLCILARCLGFPEIRSDDVECVGIELITPDDLRVAKREGGVLRLVAELNADEADCVQLRVGPAILPFEHPLARLRGAENGVVIESRERGRVCLTGPGAGPAPTAAAILADVNRLCGGRMPKREEISDRNETARNPVAATRRYAMRVHSDDARPESILAALRTERIVYRHVEFRDGVARIVTDRIDRGRVRAFERRFDAAARGAAASAPLLEDDAG